MAKKSNSQRIAEYKKKREDDKKSSSVENKSSYSPSMSNSERIRKHQLKNSIGFDTFESDLNSMISTVDGIYKEWQTPETMANTKASVQSMYDRIGSYQEHTQMYGGADLSELHGQFKTVLDEWDDRTSLYGHYNNADAFGKAVKNEQLSQKFSGLSYAGVQNQARKYAEGSDEYNYLKNYTQYSSLEDFDKAIKGTEWVDDISNKANEFGKKIKSIEDRKKQFKNHSRGVPVPKMFDDEITAVNKEYDDYAKSIGFDSAESLNKFLDEQKGYRENLEQAKNVYKLDTGNYDEYKHYTKNEDFESKSTYKSLGFSIENFTGFSDADAIYEYINNEDARKAMNDMAEMAGASNGYIEAGYQELYDNEKQMYNYLYELDKVNGTKEAAKFLKDMEVALQKRSSETRAENQEKMLDNPVMATAFSLTSPIATLAGGAANLIAKGKDIVMGEEYNPYEPLREISNANTHGREVVSSNIAEATKGFELFGQNIASFAYNTVESMLDTVVGGGTVGPAYTVLMGANAYQQKAKELTEAGFDSSVVQTNALISGALEVAFERIGFENLMKLKGSDSILSAVTNALKSQGIVEGLEELGTAASTIVLDIATLGEKSQYFKQYNDLISRGYSEKEASKQVALAVTGELGWSTAGGFLSGIGLGGGKSFVDYSNNKSVGQDIKSADMTSNVFDMAQISPEASAAYEAYNAYAKKGINADNITDAQLGNLYNIASRETGEGIASARSDVANAKESMVKYENARRKADSDSPNSRTMKKLDGAITRYTDAQAKLGEYSERFNKMSAIEEGVFTHKANKVLEEKEAEKKAKHEAEVKELSSGVETSVIANTDKAIEIKGIKDKNTLITNEGEVSLDDVLLTDTDAELLVYAKSMDTDEANMFVEQYDRNADVSIDEYANDFNRVYDYAKNKGFTQDYILENKGSLTATQASAIYTNTRIKADHETQVAIDEATAKLSGKMNYRGTFNDSIIDRTNSNAEGKVNWNSLSYETRRLVSFAELCSKALGYNVVLEKDKPYNGKITKDNTIYIDINARNKVDGVWKNQFIPTLSHEITHSFERTAPELYRRLEELVFSTLEAKDGISEGDRVATEIARLNRDHPEKKHNEKDARSEIIARACEDMLSLSKEGRKMFDSLTEAEQKSFVEKVKEIIESIKEWIDELLGQYSSTSYEAKALRQQEEQLNEILKLWDTMLVESKKVNEAGVFKAENNSTDGDVEFADRKTSYTEKQYNDFGWVKANGLLSNGEYKDFWSKFAAVKSGQTEFKKSKSGEFIIPVSDINNDAVYTTDNKLVFAKGNIDNPKITSIIIIDLHNETELDVERRNIYELERRGIQPKDGELFRRYYPDDFTMQQSKKLYESGRNSNDNGFGRRSGEETSKSHRTNEIKFADRSTDVATQINTSMTMDEAKQMIQRAFILGGIKEWYDGEYKNGDEWLRGEGASEVALYIENEYALSEKYLHKLQGYTDGDFYAEDILEAYLKGTLIGKEKPKAKRLDISKEYRINDERFYSPQRIKDVKKLLNVATQRVTEQNRAEVSNARAKILLFAHNKGASELLGLTQAELNKKLRAWSNYSAKARDISKRFNNGVADSNKWTGIENCSRITGTIAESFIASFLSSLCLG